MPTPPEPDPHTTDRGQQPSRRLNRVQQLTLTTWRHASASVGRHVMTNDILAHVAIHAIQAVWVRCVRHPTHSICSSSISTAKRSSRSSVALQPTIALVTSCSTCSTPAICFVGRS